MTDKMIELYKQLSTNEKRNELSSLIVKLDYLINQILQQKNIKIDINNSKNYDSAVQKDQTEDQMLLFFYDDLWNIKNKILSILVNDMEVKNNANG